MKSMKVLVVSCALISGVAAGPAIAAGSEEEAVALVRELEASGRPAAEIVMLLVEDGRRVDEATALTVAAANTAVTRSYATLFGMCLAPARSESPEAVGAAAIAATADRDAAVTGFVHGFYQEQCGEYFTLLRPPGPVGVEPRGPGIPPPVSPSN